MVTLDFDKIDRYRISPGTGPSLSQRDSHEHALFPAGKRQAKRALKPLRKRIYHLQRLLYAERKRRLLIVIQSMDAGGKDSTVRHVFRNLVPQGVHVVSFVEPTGKELAHDYLWRIHRHVPAHGEIVIFNRSHYEDVLVVRVNDLVPRERWLKRCQHINDFERMLTDEGVTILKFFLHISKQEQKQQIKDRLHDPTKHWKFKPKDLEERQRWGEYMRAYEAVFKRTSTPWAPWHVIPGDRRWYRDLLIAHLTIRAMEDWRMQYPRPDENLGQIKIPD